MNSVILYLLETSALLSLFYAVYFFFLRKEATINFNRFYLLLALVLAFVFPLLSFDFQPARGGMIDQPITQLSDVRRGYQKALLEWSYQPIDGQGVRSEESTRITGSVARVLSYLYMAGAIFLLLRLAWMIGWMIKLQRAHPHRTIKGVRVVLLPFQSSPFSFLRCVFVSEEQVETEEFAHILDHEVTHIQQRHSLDLLFVQLTAAVIWFNPVIWWLLKSLKTTHEYIADRNMMKKGYSLVEYQTLLLRQMISNNSFGLVHHFNLSFIKKRITMMNIERISGFGKTKVALVTALTFILGLVLIQCNSKLEEQLISDQSDASSIALPLIEYSGFEFHKPTGGSPVISIKENQVFLNGEELDISKLPTADWGADEKAPVIFRVDKGQAMGLVHEVQELLRELDRRLLLYEGQVASGATEQIAFLLPPSPDSEAGIQVPVLTPEFVAENGIQVTQLVMNNPDFSYDNLVYNQLNNPMIPKESFVVRGTYTKVDSYGTYLSALQKMKLGFYRLYDERAHEMFGKGFMEINRDQQISAEAKTQFRAVREGIPMSIVVEML